MKQLAKLEKTEKMQKLLDLIKELDSFKLTNDYDDDLANIHIHNAKVELLSAMQEIVKNAYHYMVTPAS